jgi:hypothetical protein
MLRFFSQAAEGSGFASRKSTPRWGFAAQAIRDLGVCAFVQTTVGPFSLASTRPVARAKIQQRKLCSELRRQLDFSGGCLSPASKVNSANPNGFYSPANQT